MNVVEKTGKTVEDAVRAALQELGVSRDQVDVDILASSKSSILGLFGGRDAKVRVTVKETAPAPEPEQETPAEEVRAEEVPEAAAEAETAPAVEEAPAVKPKVDKEEERKAAANAAKAFLENIFKAMGMNLMIEKFINRKEDEIVLKIHGDGIGVLIGKHGQTLDALQYLTNLAANKGHKDWNRVILDAENYRERRRQTLERLARNLADRVKRTGKKAMLEPMNPYERKIVHLSLQNDPAITTYSEGEEPYRKVVIDLK